MIFSKLKISYKLPLIIVSLAAVSVIAVSLLSIKTSSDVALTAAKLKLSSLNYSKVERLENYLHSIDEDLDILARSQDVLEAIQYFNAGWTKIQDDPTVINPTAFIQKLYIEENQYPIGEKEKLDYQNDDSLYSQVHKNYHPWFRHVLKTRDYYDIFLFNAEGDLVYSVFKEADFATNAHAGAWKDSDLSKAFRTASNEPNTQHQDFFDFKPYAASNDAPASFIAEAVLDKNGTLAGVIAFQMPINRINEIMKVSEDAGDTAEVYIVGEDYLMRNDSNKTPQQYILPTKIETLSVTKGLKGEKGVLTGLDYHSKIAMQSYAPFRFNGVNWVVIAEQNYDEIMKPIREMTMILILEISIALLIIGVIGIWFARRISKPISNISAVMHKIAEGDFDIKIPGINRRDEIGAMAASV